MKTEKLESQKMKVTTIVGAAMILCGFILLTIWVVQGKTISIDGEIMAWIYEARVPGLNTLFETITYTGDWFTITAICILLLAFDKTRKIYGVPISIIAIFVTVINKIIKILVERPRPFEDMMLIEQGGYSFPSGHAVTALAVYGLLAYLVWKHYENKKKANIFSMLLIILAVSVGISRVYLGVHYPSDVLAGWLLATFSLLLTHQIVLPYQKKCSCLM